VYILVGYVTDDDLPTFYIGQGDGDVVRARLESHAQNKDFWSKAVVFVSSSASGGLNRANGEWWTGHSAYSFVCWASATGTD
jgi:hypothetical protein